ncbi:MAG: GAF domain-containing sensor histidine kinase [Dehalococcoidia bacterium]
MKTLYWLSVAAPLSFLLALAAVLELALKPALPDGPAYAVAAALAALGVFAFAGGMFAALRQAQERLRRQTDELAALYEAGMALNSELSLPAVLRRLVDLGRTLTGARFGALSVLGPDGRIEEFVHAGLSDEQRQAIGALPVGKGLLGVILREGAVLRVNDMGGDGRRVGFPANHPEMKSLLGVPVLSRGRVIGNLYLTDRLDGRPFDEADEDLVRHLAAQAAVAIDNAKLYEAERRRAEEWKALFELGEEVTASPDLGGLLGSVVEKARALLETEVAVLMLLSAEGDELEVAAESGLKTASSRELRASKTRGLQGYVIESGKPVVEADYASNPRLSEPPSHLERREGLVSVIAVPFSAKGRLLGTLTVGNRTSTAFTERQAELLAAFASWAAVAVETNDLYDGVRALALLEERERIGMDLHDGIIQSIYAVALGLEGAQLRLEEAPDDVRRQLDRFIEELNKAIRNVRSYIFDLRPQVSGAGDLAAALGELADNVRVNTLMETDVQLDGDLSRLSDDQAVELFRIAQEALNNVMRHSRARSARLTLAARDGVLSLEVADDGVGFDPEEKGDSTHSGLRNMMDRSRGLGGRLSIDSSAGKGTSVRLTVPLREAAETARP